MNILLVEDEQCLASTLKDGLEKDGHFVNVAGDGADGVAKAENHPNDVIIVDVILPVTDGLTTLNTLREKGITAPVILLTAKDAVVNQTRRGDAVASERLIDQRALSQLVSKVRSILCLSLQ